MTIKYYAEGNCVFAEMGGKKWIHSKCLSAATAEAIAANCNDNSDKDDIIEYFAYGFALYGVNENGKEMWIMDCLNPEQAEETAEKLNARLV